MAFAFSVGIWCAWRWKIRLHSGCLVLAKPMEDTITAKLSGVENMERYHDPFVWS